MRQEFASWPKGCFAEFWTALAVGHRFSLTGVSAQIFHVGKSGKKTNLSRPKNVLRQSLGQTGLQSIDWLHQTQMV